MNWLSLTSFPTCRSIAWNIPSAKCCTKLPAGLLKFDCPPMAGLSPLLTIPCSATMWATWRSSLPLEERFSACLACGETFAGLRGTPAVRSGTRLLMSVLTTLSLPRQILTVPGGLVLDDISSEGRVLMTHSSERTIVMVSTRRHPEEQNLGWLDNTEFFRFSGDGTQIVLGDESSASGARHASFLRNVDGSSAVRVGDGDAIAL